MQHTEIQSLLDAYVDDELDLVSSLTVERHLNECRQGCPQLYQQRLRLRTAMQADVLYFKPSTAFQQQILTSIRRVGQPTTLNFPERRLWIGMAAAAIALL